MQVHCKQQPVETRFYSFDDPRKRSVDELFVNKAFQNIEKWQLWWLLLKKLFAFVA